MSIETLCDEIDSKYEQLKAILNTADLSKIIETALEMHALVHPSAISGIADKTIADHVLEYMMQGNQNELVPRKNFDAYALRRYRYRASCLAVLAHIPYRGSCHQYLVGKQAADI